MSQYQTIVVLATGGTIASTRSEAGRNRSGVLSGEDLVGSLDLSSLGDKTVRVVAALQKPSNAVTFDDLLVLRARCEDIASQDGVAGIVITHGTDTLEDTAFFLDLTLPRGLCPLVVTGSQRAPHELGSDAHRNLRDAIVAASDERVRQMGVLVAFNENLYPARRVTKVHTYQLAGFDAPGCGRLGFIDHGQVYLECKDIADGGQLVPGDALARVDILPAYLDASAALVDAAIESGAQGLVLDALGRGHVPPLWVEKVRFAVESAIPVVVTSSCADGPVYSSYDFPGCLSDLEQVGAIRAPGLNPRKARLKLAILLSRSDCWTKDDVAHDLQAASMRGIA